MGNERETNPEEAATKAQEILTAAQILAKDNSMRVRVSQKKSGEVVYRLWDEENPGDQHIEIVDEGLKGYADVLLPMLTNKEELTKNGNGLSVEPLDELDDISGQTTLIVNIEETLTPTEVLE